MLHQVGVRTNAGEVASQFADAARAMRDRATMRALNEVADQAKVASARQIRDVGYKLKISAIKKGIEVKRATLANLRAAVIARGRPIPLIEYSARQTSKGVSVSVLNGRKLIPGAFIVTMPSGHRGVFVREENARHKKMTTRGKPSWHSLGIRELFGPAVPDGMANKEVADAFERFVDQAFPAILDREFAFLAKLGRRR
ncbi:MAG: phage tail protein [Opitutaceae bacterium]|nr:phage tail protein [Opitutaceae bacterium]